MQCLTCGVGWLMSSEISQRADFSQLRYAQCWEDADLLLAAMRPQAGRDYLSIASAGDNTLALVAQGPRRVVAVDLSQVQLAALELRVAAYQQLDYPDLLALLGVQASARRLDLYARCRPALSATTQRFWDSQEALLLAGMAVAGRFERYLRLFGTRILPLIHPLRIRLQLLVPRSPAARHQFYDQVWDSWRWRSFFRLFFSRTVMARLGRSPAFFHYVEGNVADRILARTHHALTVLDPSRNPYLQWILLGEYATVLPYAWRAENFQAIRANLGCLEWHHQSLEDYLADSNTANVARSRHGSRIGSRGFAGFNLSDIFEYMAPAAYASLLQQLVAVGQPGARLVYWNMLVPRQRPVSMANQLLTLPVLAAQLHAQDQAFFYSSLVVEQVI